MLTTVPLALGSAPLALGPAWLTPETMLHDLGGVALWGAALVIFAECGLLLGFFLPGDSLLFTVGLFIGRDTIHQSIWLALPVLAIAAFAGNVVGYEIGRFSGPAVFGKGNSKIFKQEYVDKTMGFFEKHGPRAIVLARFVPIVRTFITVTAGVGRMDRRKYLTYSAIGAALWACGVTYLGKLLGNNELIKNHIEAALLLIVLISVLPMGIEYLRHRLSAGRNPGTGEPPARTRRDAEPEPIPGRGRHAGPGST